MTKEKDKDLVSVNKNDNLMFSGDFDHVLHEISKTVERTSKLISTQNLEQASENLSLTQIDDIIDDLSQAQTMARAVEKGRRQLRKAFNVRRDLVVKQFDEKVNKAGYDKLASYHQSAKDLKKMVRQKRKNDRLENIVKPMFNSLVKSYPTLNELAPTLADSNNFVLNNPSIVGGGKKDVDKAELKQVITAYLSDIEHNLIDLKKNIYQLGPAMQNAIFKAYVANPTNETYQTAVAQMLTQKQLAHQPIQEAQQAVQTDDLTAVYNWLVNYITFNLRVYKNIRTDYDQRLALMIDLLNQYQDRSSYLWQNLLNNCVNSSFVMYNLIYDIFRIQ